MRRSGKSARRNFPQVIDVNLKGMANVIRHFVPAMVKNKSGVIVNFSSGWGRSTDAEVAPYCATKWAIEGLTQALAQELPPGMAAVPLNPGIINTGMLRSCFGVQPRDIQRRKNGQKSPSVSAETRPGGQWPTLTVPVRGAND